MVRLPAQAAAAEVNRFVYGLLVALLIESIVALAVLSTLAAVRITRGF